MRRVITVIVCMLAGLAGMPASATAPDCQVLMSQQQIDYGAVTEAQLQAPAGKYPAGHGWGALAARDLTVTVVCPQPGRIRLYFDGDSASRGLFRYGEEGVVRVQASSAVMDNRPVRLRRVTAGGEQVVRDALNIHAGDGLSLVDGHEVSGKTASIQLTIMPWLKKTVLSQRERLQLLENIRIRVETPDAGNVPAP
ncbi:hypothetical protein [Enterobacter sp. 22466]|uniref:hypothetical protein n=1 Tax=Enterobacter sp. 22466 TaxID=3453924 RepID=UPI003F83F4EC